MSRAGDPRRPPGPHPAGGTEADIDEELRFHVEGRIEELMAGGMSRPEAARRAREAFGDLERIRGECAAIRMEGHQRRARREWMGDLLRDLGLAGRRLRRRPGFTAIAALILALGVGTTVAMFSVLHAVVLQPLPYAQPDRLVALWPGKTFNAAMVRYFDRELEGVDGVAGLSTWTFTLLGEGRPEQVPAAVVSPGIFRTLGITPLIGRTLLPEEQEPAAADVVVLSHGFWLRRFGGDPGVVGRELRLEAHGRAPVHRVVGVLPPGVDALGTAVDVWAPLQLAAGHTVRSDSSWHVNQVVARLAAGTSMEEATDRVRAVAVRLQEEFPMAAEAEDAAGAGVRPLVDVLVGPVRPLLWALFAAVGLVLLIACGNLTTLLLARNTSEAGERGIRAALGAGRARLVREQLLESVLLGLLGGAAGTALGLLLVARLQAPLEAALPRGAAVELSVPLLLFALGVTVLSVLLTGTGPAFKGAADAVRQAARGGGGGAAVTRERHRVSRALVGVQVALALVLSVGAALALRSLGALAAVDPGFRVEGVAIARVEPPPTRFATTASRIAYFEAVEQRIRALPGVEETGGIHLPPMGPSNWSFPYLAEGHQPPPDAPLPSANFRVVTPGYFRTLGIPVVRGRAITGEDGASAPQVVVINQAMAELLWPGRDPLGKEIKLFGSQPMAVVGVVGDVRQRALDIEPVPEMYRPFRQWTLGFMTLAVRTRGEAARLLPGLRQAVWDVDPDVPVEVRTLADLQRETVLLRRLLIGLLMGFGGLALLLAGLGVYGVTAHVVSRRVPEFGLRLALGARPGQVVRQALTTGLIPAAVGLAVGLAGALAATRLLRGILYGVAPVDPLGFLAGGAALAACAVLASLLPARRASRVDPVEVLRGP